MLDGFAGTIKGSFFQSPNDTSKPAHENKIDFDPLWYRPYLTGAVLLFTPNLVWLLIAGVCFVLFPYRPLSRALLVERAALNCGLVLLFFGFWHVTLYLLEWGKRPFKPNRVYRLGKVAHNAFYSLAGALVWTGMEMGLLFCYQTGRIAPAQHTVLNVLVWCYLGIVIRDIHFYFAHRLIHMRFLYSFVHSLHHRNVDVEPFSGLCMHTAEHLHYFACALIPALL
jgi:sterol desaturase/sphingolipid hydroxylase (fatty acid hydroxylase superfamily)